MKTTVGSFEKIQAERARVPELCATEGGGKSLSMSGCGREAGY